jgi:raffinose/stachyose/melibiose transport system permease protein
VRTRRRVLSAVKYVVLTIVAIPWVIVPALLVILNSFKPEGEAAQLQLTLPTQWRIVENYGLVFTVGGYWSALGNTLIVTIPIVLGVIVLGAMASWTFGRSDGKLTRLGYFAIILSILIPPAIIPTIQMLRWAHVGETQFAYVFVMIATRMGLLVFLATGFVRALPRDLEEAAQIDGASNLRVFWSLIMPLLRPVLFVGGVILLITIWGDFFYAQFLLPAQNTQTLQLSLFTFASASTKSLNWNLVFAHLVMTSLPLVVIYLIAQRQVIGGLSEGALKG